MQATNYLMQAMLNVARGTNLVAPNAFYLGLFQSDPTVSGTTSSEISYTGYARQVITFSSTNQTNSGYITNSAQIDFPVVPRDTSQTVTHVGVMDAETGGNMWLFAQLADSVSLYDAVKIFFATSALKWTISGIFTSDYRLNFLNFFKNGTTVTGFTPYLALYNSTGTEKSSGGYARQQIDMTLNTTGYNSISNTYNVDFPVATGSWSTVAQSAIVDAASSGTKFAVFTLTNSFTVPAGSQVRVNAGSISITMQDA